MGKHLYIIKPSLAFATLVVVVLLAVIVAVYFDDMPVKPKCGANEIAVLNGDWYCVTARKP